MSDRPSALHDPEGYKESLRREQDRRAAVVILVVLVVLLIWGC